MEQKFQNCMKKTFVVLCFVLFFVAGHSQSYPRMEGAIRVMSYNIRNARGLDNKVDYQRIAAIIARANPDVVALQELDSATNRSNRVDVLSQLSGLTAMYSVYGASIHFDGGKYGVGVLSKQKPISWKRIPLPGREEARSLLVVEFDDYVFCCTHFSLIGEDRITSVEIINQTAMVFEKPVFLAGDINATPESPVLNAFEKNWTVLSNMKQPTFPADHPAQTIDYILGYTPKGFSYSVWQAQVLNEPVASDHLPIFADVRMKKIERK